MKKTTMLAATLGALLSLAMTGVDKYSVKVPGGLGFSEFRGYETWPVVSLSDNNGRFAIILGNPTLIEAYKAGIPGNGKAFPDGSKIAKLHYTPLAKPGEPGAPRVAGTQINADFMIKDRKRFAETGGWGYASFDLDPSTGQFTASTDKDSPPQGHDAKCGAACHTIAKEHDFVFTTYATK